MGTKALCYTRCKRHVNNKHRLSLVVNIMIFASHASGKYIQYNVNISTQNVQSSRGIWGSKPQSVNDTKPFITNNKNIDIRDKYYEKLFIFLCKRICKQYAKLYTAYVDLSPPLCIIQMARNLQIHTPSFILKI